jgi:hypothetical protein
MNDGLFASSLDAPAPALGKHLGNFLSCSAGTYSILGLGWLPLLRTRHLLFSGGNREPFLNNFDQFPTIRRRPQIRAFKDP